MKTKKLAPPGEDKASSFDQFGLKPELMKAIAAAGFKTPSAIQEKAIPLIIKGHDIVGQAKTGTGKTAAFGLPALNLLNPISGKVELLVITPTRELATQVSDEIQRFGQYLGIRSVSICGGRSYSRQIESIKMGAQVVVATPGRLLDLLNTKRIPKLQPSIIVLDEADEMLDMGFLEDIQSIFDFLPEERQTLLFSATMPLPIQRLAKRILKAPIFVSIEQGGELTNQDTTQRAFAIEEHERDDALMRLIDSEKPFKSIIFCRTRNDVDRLQSALVDQGYPSASLHGDLEQRQREKVIGAFRDGKIQVLVATDVAARGLNVLDVTHVFNYQLPSGAESYVHRIGRTGRAGNKGSAITLLTPSEFHKLAMIKKAVGSVIEFGTIPTLSDMQKKHLLDFASQIKHQASHKEAAQLLELLKKEVDSETLCTKLISLFLSQQSFLGPEQIGISKDKVSKMGSRQDSSSRERPRFNRGGPRSHGGGGGGGERSGRSGGGFGGGGERSGRSSGSAGRPRSDAPASTGPRQSSGQRPSTGARPAPAGPRSFDRAPQREGRDAFKPRKKTRG